MRNPCRHRLAFIPVILILTLLLASFDVLRKETVTFASSDGLVITADEYIMKSTNPYILLFHEQGSSRGEYRVIAKKLCKMDYNCLAVDLRNGGNVNPVSNETVKRCRESRCPVGANDVVLDMVAAIDYVHGKTNLPVILFGSGANASLSLKLARESEDVRAVVAFSPGEYFLPEISIHDTITDLRKPVFVTSSLSELPYVSQLVSGMDEEYLNIFEPRLGEGCRGSMSLANENSNHSEYWLALLLFFKDLV